MEKSKLINYSLSYQIFKLDWVMLSVIILAILAALMYEGIALLERKCLKWQQ